MSCAEFDWRRILINQVCSFSSVLSFHSFWLLSDDLTWKQSRWRFFSQYSLGFWLWPLALLPKRVTSRSSKPAMWKTSAWQGSASSHHTDSSSLWTSQQTHVMTSMRYFSISIKSFTLKNFSSVEACFFPITHFKQILSQAASLRPIICYMVIFSKQHWELQSWCE